MGPSELTKKQRKAFCEAKCCDIYNVLKLHLFIKPSFIWSALYWSIPTSHPNYVYFGLILGQIVQISVRLSLVQLFYCNVINAWRNLSFSTGNVINHIHKLKVIY